MNLSQPDRLLVGGALGLTFALVATLSVSPENRGKTRANWVLLLLFAAMRALNTATHSSPSLEKAILGVEYFFLLLSLARSSVHIFLDGLAIRIFRSRPSRIVSDLLQGLLTILVIVVALQATGMNPTSLLTTSAVFTAVLGLSLQETLGNLFAGLAIQAEEPFGVGDFIEFEAGKMGQVLEINWRATKIVTNQAYVITVPNSVLARASIVNYSRPEAHVRRHVIIDVPYDAPAGVSDILAQSVRGIEGVEDSPHPDALLMELAESSLRYRLRFFTSQHHRRELVESRVLAAAFHALRRHGIEVPFPVRRVELVRPSPRPLEAEPPEEHIGRVSLFSPLTDASKKSLSKGIRRLRFAPEETILRQGDPGSELFVITHGRVRVEIEAGERVTRVATLEHGEFFGEMSLFTGEPRTATCVAETEVEVLVATYPIVKAILEAEPGVLDRISEELARRQTLLSAQLAQVGSLYPPEPSGQLRDRIAAFFRLDPKS